MKAAVLKNDMDMVIEDVPSPAPGEEQVLIRVKWSGICGTDLHIYLGEFKDRVFKELQIVGSRVTLGDYPRALRLMELNKFHPQLLISEVVGMNELDKAFHLLEEKPDQYLKILVKHQ